MPFRALLSRKVLCESEPLARRAGQLGFALAHHGCEASQKSSLGVVILEPRRAATNPVAPSTEVDLPGCSYSRSSGPIPISAGANSGAAALGSTLVRLRDGNARRPA